jgi:histone arginine demethylase JMJD6
MNIRVKKRRRQNAPIKFDKGNRLDEEVKRRIDEAKRQQRPHLKLRHWSSEDYASNRKVCANLPGLGVVTRLHCCDLSVFRFADQFERSNLSAGRPCLIDGVPQAENWKATQRWSWKKLTQAYGRQKMTDKSKTAVSLYLADFIAYMQQQEDDSPLYIFDGTFGIHPVLSGLLQDYTQPRFVGSDLFALLGEQRPPFRWFLLGPRRSGSNVHIDPLATSAWNTLITGRKRWILFDPRTPKAVAKGLSHVMLDNDAVHWFTEVLPRVKEDVAALDFDPPLAVVEFVQEESQTVFVPSDWWHAVLNLEDTIAITQNFASATNLDNVWRSMRRGRRRLSQIFLRKLESAEPELAARLHSAEKKTREERDAGAAVVVTDAEEEARERPHSPPLSESSSDSDQEDEGPGEICNWDQRIAWLRKAAATGRTDAQYNLGVCFHSGQGVEQDSKQAAAWYRQAAAQGEVNAQYGLALMYRTGQGVRPDLEQAAVLFQKAADQGSAEAQCSLGEMYRIGDGVRQDAKQAVALFQKAVDQGYTHAHLMLGLISEGLGDYTTAISSYMAGKEADPGFSHRGIAECKRALGA